jgi:hypothetical protein
MHGHVNVVQTFDPMVENSGYEKPAQTTSIRGVDQR